MLVKLRREYAHIVTSGAQFIFLIIGFRLNSHIGWLTCLSSISFVSVLAWLSALRNLRAIRDTPTSKISSAAQGYVELIGRGKIIKEAPLLSKFTSLPCLWYRYTVKKRDYNDQWKTVDHGESHDCFLLSDDTGLCLVDPEQAEIITKHRDQWEKEGYQYTEWKLIDQDHLYVIGQFRTQGGVNLEFDSRADLNALLADWKKNMPKLHTRFDLNNDGELDMREWMLARSAAKREVAKMIRNAQAQPDTHIIGQPHDGKLFLISNLMPKKLSSRYLLWSWAHLLSFSAAVGSIGWLQQNNTF